MHIVAAKPLKGGSLLTMEYALRALQALGHTVTALDFSHLLPLLRRATTDGDLQSAHLIRRETTHTIVEALRTTRADLLFGVAQSPIFGGALRYCKKRSIPTVYWFVEDFRRFPYWRKIAGQYDAFFVIQREPFLSLLRRVGARPFFLPLAADLDIHRPMALSGPEQAHYGAVVSFVGAGYPNRVAILERLNLHSLKIWGSDWYLSPQSPLRQALQQGVSRISPKEYVKVFNATAVNLNLHSSLDPNEVGRGDFVNPRTFEIAACRAFQLVDRRTLLPDLFKEGEEIVTFATEEELRATIEAVREEAPYRHEMALKAYRRVVREHTYLHRMLTLLEVVTGKEQRT